MSSVDASKGVGGRVFIASLITWPVSGLTTWFFLALVYSQDIHDPFPSPSQRVFATLFMIFLFTPFIEGVFLGHFVFIYGLFRLAKLSNAEVPAKRDVRITVLILFSATLQKFGASLAFAHGWMNPGLALETGVATAVVWFTRSSGKHRKAVRHYGE